MNLDSIYKQYNCYFNLLALSRLVKKNSIVFYKDNNSQTLIFGFVLPSWQTNRPNYLGGHIHVNALPFEAVDGLLDYNLKEAKMCYACLMVAYFNTALRDLSDCAKQYVAGKIMVKNMKNFAKDFIYILQLYM